MGNNGLVFTFEPDQLANGLKQHLEMRGAGQAGLLAYRRLLASHFGLGGLTWFEQSGLQE